MAEIRSVLELRSVLPDVLGDLARFVARVEVDGSALVLFLASDPAARFALESRLGALDQAIRSRVRFPFSHIRLSRDTPTDQANVS